jgi:hypothetical protein
MRYEYNDLALFRLEVLWPVSHEKQREKKKEHHPPPRQVTFFADSQVLGKGSANQSNMQKSET